MMDALRERFLHPSNTYRPIPFWFLNGALTETELRRQLEDFHAHGVGGVVLHARQGLSPDVGYMTDRWLDLIAFAVDVARELGMIVFLYDEGMYPSGSCHGQVVRAHPEYAARGLRMTVEERPETGRTVARLALRRVGEAAFDAGSVRELTENEPPRAGETIVWLTEQRSGGTIRGLFPGEDDGEPNAPPAADLLNPEATRRFLRLTHERYYARMPERFGETIRAIFTDEPNPLGRRAARGLRPWTAGLEDVWQARGHSLTELPALFWDAGDTTAAVREAYERMVDDRLLEAFYLPLQRWCHEHRVALTGHPARADDFAAERAFDIPGQDLVWRFVAPGPTALTGPESAQGHCAADAALRAGRFRCLSECFGCCGPAASQWGMTVSDMKWMLDYLFVRGVNLIVPHAFHYAPEVIDRPPDVGPLSPWWPHFRQIADYIARLSMLNAEGEPRARVAVRTAGAHLPWRVPGELLRRQIDFRYVTPEDDVSSFDAVIGDDAPSVAALLPFAGATLAPPCEDIRVRWTTHGATHVFLLTNEGDAAYEGRVTLPVRGACEQWDAWSGTTASLGLCDGPLSLRLTPRASVIFAVDEQAEPRPAAPVPPAVRRWMPLDGFTPPLGDAQTLPGRERFSGTLVYEAAFSLPERPARAVLDLGDVRDLAVVSVNGGEEQALLLPPFTLDVTARIQVGVNHLRIAVTGGWPTRFDGLPWPCGLMGPVRLGLV